jgi:hypothetical protein
LGELQVVPVEGKRLEREFLNLPYRLYRNSPVWVPPLRMAQKELFDVSKHPFYRHGSIQRYVAIRSGETVGRIAAILDPKFNEFHQENAGFFGFLEAVEDAAVFAELLGAARKWLASRGVEVMRGPVNPSTNYECGVLVDSFDRSPMLMMTYNPPYYGPLIEAAGFVKAKDLVAYDLPALEAHAERLATLLKRMRSSGISLRPLDMSRFDHEVETAWIIYNSAWVKNWGFVPMSREEFFHHGKEMKPVVVPRLAIVAMHGEKVAGLAVALPDINEALKHVGGRLLPTGIFKLLWHKRRIQRLRVIMLGVLEQYRTTAATAGLYAALIRECLALGYWGAECSWVLEDNVLMRRAIEGLGGKLSKTYRIYEASLADR